MRFLALYAASFVLCFLFVFFGGLQLLCSQIYLTTAVFALALAIILHVLLRQSDRICQLEARIRSLEEKAETPR